MLTYDAGKPNGFGVILGTAVSPRTNCRFCTGSIPIASGASPGLRLDLIIRAWDVRSGPTWDTALIRGDSGPFRSGVIPTDPDGDGGGGEPWIGIPERPGFGLVSGEPDGFHSFCLQRRYQNSTNQLAIGACGGPLRFTLVCGAQDARQATIASTSPWLKAAAPLVGVGTGELTLLAEANRSTKQRTALVETPGGSVSLTQSGVSETAFNTQFVGFRQDGLFHLRIEGSPCTVACLEVSEDLQYWECVYRFEIPEWGHHSPWLSEAPTNSFLYFRVATDVEDDGA